MNESPDHTTHSPTKTKSSDKILSEKRSSSEKKSYRTSSTSASPDKYSRTYEKHKILHSDYSDSEHEQISSKNSCKQGSSPITKKSSNQTVDSPKVNSKQKILHRDRSRSSSVQSFQSNDDESQKSAKSWKSKLEMKDGNNFKSVHKSPSSSVESLSKERKNVPQLIDLSPTHKKIVLNDNPALSPKSNITSPPNDSSQKVIDFETEKKRHGSKSPELHNLNKNTPKKIQIHLKDKNSSLENEKISFNIKSVNISHQSENKTKFNDLYEDSEVKDADNTSDVKTNKFGIRASNNLQNQNSELLLDSSIAKKDDKSNYTNMNFPKTKSLSSKNRHERKRHSETPESTPSRSRSISQNPDFEKDNKKRMSKISHSRSRSTSAAHSSSTSASDRSSRSRSRSYSNRRSKSYSKSRSKSFSKSPSHSKSKSRSKSKSWSKSISKSRSKSFSRSRSKSYSRSRSRSRSISAYSR